MSDLYKFCSSVYEKVKSKKGSLKGLVYSGKRSKHFERACFALLSEALKYHELIEKIIGQTPLQKDIEHSKFNRWMVFLLVYEFLFGQGKVKGGGVVKKAVLENLELLKNKLNEMKIDAKVTEVSQLLPEKFRTTISLPRYVRVNTMVCSKSEAIEYLTKRFNLTESQLQFDPIVPNLIVFPPKFPIQNDEWVTKLGKLIIQDKSSCFSALALNPPKGSKLIDACSAPGNKTTHLASILEGTGKVFAFERDKRRFQILSSMVEKCHAKNVQAIQGDFLKTRPNDKQWNEVEYILVDPSCSGSGIVERLDYDDSSMSENQQQNDGDRVSILAAFQKKIVSHALKFSNVKRVVYSTCSINKEENEEVVQSVLRENPSFQLVACLTQWNRRGDTSVFAEASHCVRTLPSEDQTNGFFVSCFERKTNKHHNSYENSIKPNDKLEDNHHKQQTNSDSSIVSKPNDKGKHNLTPVIQNDSPKIKLNNSQKKRERDSNKPENSNSSDAIVHLSETQKKNRKKRRKLSHHKAITE